MSKKHHKKNKHPKHQHEAVNEHKSHSHAQEKKSAPPSAGMQIMGWIGMVLLLAFLAVNIALSQMIHPLYQGVVDGNKTALVTFFKIAKNLPAFEPLKPEMQNSYLSLAEEIDGENITRQEKIKKIEALLVQYPKSRDLLYAASILYTDIGNKEKGAEYLQKARDIDPSL
jgi:tetratricopeptide (TPR) repeat protein